MVGSKGGIQSDCFDTDLKDPARVPHRMFCIGAEIHEELMHLGRISRDHASMWTDLRLDRDGRGQGEAQQGEGFLNQQRERYGLALLGVAPAEREDPLDEVFGALPCPQDFLEMLPGRAGCRQIVSHKLCIANHGS